MAWFVTVVAVLATWAALRLLLPPAGPPTRIRLAGARAAERMASQLRGVPEPDPFEVLRLQTRLGVLAEHIRDLEADPYVYAKAHRLQAARAAYDDLLDEACRLAGVPVDSGVRRSESHRWDSELELASRGWSW
jgi:hypothetical protein